MNRDETIKTIRANLRRRSGKAWSVKSGRGTACGWITITPPPRRRTADGYMSDADRTELGTLLNASGPVHMQGEKVPSSFDYYDEYVDRSAGRTPAKCGQPCWD